MLSYLAVAILSVTAWEVARILLRTARFVPEADATAGEPPSFEIHDARTEAAALQAPGGESDGWNVFRHVCHGDVEGLAALSPARQAWLKSLTADERAALRRAMPARIERHLNRLTTLRGVRHVEPLQPVVTLRDIVERSGGGGGPRRPR